MSLQSRWAARQNLGTNGCYQKVRFSNSVLLHTVETIWLQREILPDPFPPHNLSFVMRLFIWPIAMLASSAIMSFASEAIDAYDRLVEELLASPEYGKRWARHWLDPAGYADSDGYHRVFCQRST